MNSNDPHQSRGGGERLLSILWRKPASSLAERTRRRVTLHLVPYLFFLYILAYLDRVNVSVAQLAMKEPPLSALITSAAGAMAPPGSGSFLGVCLFGGRSEPFGLGGLGF